MARKSSLRHQKQLNKLSIVWDNRNRGMERERDREREREGDGEEREGERAEK